MLSTASRRLIDDLKTGENVSLRLRRILSSESRISQAEKLELSTSVLDIVTSTPKRSHETFLEALEFLRSLVPHMKTKKQSLLDTTASVERYSVNYGLCYGSESVESPPMTFLQDGLRKIIEVRTAQNQKLNAKATRSRSRSAKVEKENFDPEQCDDGLDDELNSCLFFSSFNKLTLKSLVPDADSPIVAATIAGAMTVLFTTNKESYTLSQLLSVAKRVITPWIEYLYSADDSLKHTACSYASRISRFLLLRCQTTKSDLFDVFKVRCFAIKLGEVKLTRYTRDLLQSANNLVRNKKLSPEDRPRASNLVRQEYARALRFVLSFDEDDPRWIYEDVSAWIDNVLLEWSKQKPMRRMLPELQQVLQIRKAKAAQSRNYEYLSKIFSLQQELFTAGAYCSELTLRTEDGVQVFFNDTWKSIQDVFDRQDFTELAFESKNRVQVTDFEGPGKTEIEVCLEQLRLLRTLEPLRQVIVAVPKDKCSLPRGGEFVLRLCLISLSEGLSTSRSEAFSQSRDELSVEVESRLQKMVGGAIQASRSLLRHYWEFLNPLQFGCVYNLTTEVLMHHERFSVNSASKWRTWVFVPILGRFESQLALSTKMNSKDRVEALERIGQIAEACTDESKSLSQDEAASTELASLLQIAREAYASMRKWSSVARVSLKWLCFHAAFKNKHGRCDTRAFEVVQTFIHDTVNTVLKDSVPLSFDSDYLTPEFIISIFHEYLWWTYSNTSEFKSVEQLDQLRTGIRITRMMLSRSYMEAKRSCPVHILHSQWIVFACEASKTFTNQGNKSSKVLSKKSACEGHKHTGFFAIDVCETPCNSKRSSYVQELRRVWTATKTGEFSETGKSLSKMLKLISLHSEVMESLELRISSLEILEWVCVQLNLHSYCILANQAWEVLMHCLPSSNGYKSESPLLDIGNVLKQNPFTKKDSFSTRHFRGEAESFDLISEAAKALNKLKEILIQLESSRRRKQWSSHTSIICAVAGVETDIGYDVRNEVGKRTLCKVLLLIQNLIQVAIILLSMENMADTKYYAEKCLFVTNQCLPSKNLVRRLVNTMYVTTCVPEALRRSEVEQKLHSTALEIFDTADRGGEQSATTPVLFELSWSMLDTILSRFHEHANHEHNLPVLDLLEHCKLVMETKTKTEANNSITNIELRLLMGVACTVLGNYEKAEHFINQLASEEYDVPADTAMFTIFNSVWCVLQLHGNVNLLHGDPDNAIMSNEKEVARITRSRTRRTTRTATRGTDAKLESALDGIQRRLSLLQREEVWHMGQPWVQRRVLNMIGFLHGDGHSQVSRAPLSIGTSFNVRHKHATHARGRAERSSDESSHAFQQTSMPSILTSASHFEIVTDWLRRNRSVLVSISIDESRRVMLIWRMSPNGTTSKLVMLETTGPVSLDGINCRMEELLKSVKAGAAKPGQKFSKEEKIAWWEERSRLDKQMQNILHDIENEWLGETGSAMLTPSITSVPNKSSNTRRGKSRTRSGRTRNEKVEESPESVLEALQQLSISDQQETLLGHLILMTDTVLERIPWESLPLLRELNVSTSRIPSLSYLYQHILEPCNTINSDKVFYVINPAGDLKKTESHFQELLRSHPSWVGFSGSTDAQAAASKYSGEEVFLYCGHGSGERYFPPARVCRKREAPVALLMGCSSLRPSNFGIGEQESNGTAINFLVHGSKAVVGNLWDVTDGEIDRLTTSILNEWICEDRGDGKQRVSLAEALAESRPKCVLPYLVGAACVVIGVPHLFAT